VTKLARIVRAREALEDGDVAFAAAILADLEDDLAPAGSPDFDVPRQSLGCPECSLRFTWPGELDHHQQFAHFAEAA